MKKLIFSIFAVVCTAMTLTGCLGDNTVASNYYTVTSSDKARVMSAITGKYTGYMKYYTPSLTKDSVATEYTIDNDSTVTVDYPMSFLANFVDSTMAEAKAALAKAPTKTIKLQTWIPNYIYNDTWSSIWLKGQYELYMYPTNTDISFSVDDHNYTLKLKTTAISTSDFGTIEPAIIYYNNNSQGYINMESLTVDDKTISLNWPTTFYGKK